LYRDVYLVETDPVHVTFPWEDLNAGVFVTTPSVDPLDGNATIDVKTTVRNEQSKPRDCRVLTRVIDANGLVVLRLESSATVLPGADHTFDQCGGLTEDLHLWSCDNPYLYRVNTEVFDGDRAVVCVENPLGIRKFELSQQQGLLLNGQPLKLIGVNRHQHMAYIGDAVPNSLHFKDALQIKQAGFNIVRLAHYPHDDAFLDACDQLGLLVYEEAPTWISMDGDAVWYDNLEAALRRAIRNHRNHPSVIIWGGGINHRGAVERLHYAAKQEDPTRWTASNNSAWTGSQDSGVCDIYSNIDYGNMAEFNDSEFLFAMESSSTSLKTVSLYKGDPRRIGFAAWTARAYYTFHPENDQAKAVFDRTRSGMMDVFRTPKSIWEWYRTELATNPVVYLPDDWKEGIKTVRVFSNCDKIELLVNGRSLGRKPVLREGVNVHLNSPPFTFPIESFEAGELVVRGYKEGREVASASERTPEAPAKIKLVVDLDQRQFTADGSDIVLAYAHILDANDTLVRDGRHDVKFTVNSPATIVGDGADIAANPMRSQNGIAPVLVREGKSAGKIILHAKADGLAAAEATFTSAPWNPNGIAAAAKPVYDLKKVRVDLGGEGQLVQFDWTPWIGRDSAVPALALPTFGTAKVTLRSAANEGVSRWLGEMNAWDAMAL